MRIFWSLLFVASILIGRRYAGGVEANDLPAFPEQLAMLPQGEPCVSVDVWLGVCKGGGKPRTRLLSKPEGHSGRFFTGLASPGLADHLEADTIVSHGQVGVRIGSRSLVIAESLKEAAELGASVDFGSFDLYAAGGSGIMAVLSEDGQSVTITSAGRPPMRMIILKPDPSVGYEPIFVSPNDSRTVLSIGEGYIVLVLPLESIKHMQEMGISSANNFDQIVEEMANSWAPDSAWFALQISSGDASESAQAKERASLSPQTWTDRTRSSLDGKGPSQSYDAGNTLSDSEDDALYICEDSDSLDDAESCCEEPSETKPKGSPEPQELLRSKESLEVEEFSKPEESPEVEEFSKPEESPEVEELSKPKESPEVEELSKPKESPEVEELSKPKESSEVEELSKPKESPKPEELPASERLSKPEESPEPAAGDETKGSKASREGSVPIPASQSPAQNQSPSDAAPSSEPNSRAQGPVPGSSSGPVPGRFQAFPIRIPNLTTHPWFFSPQTHRLGGVSVPLAGREHSNLTTKFTDMFFNFARDAFFKGRGSNYTYFSFNFNPLGMVLANCVFNRSRLYKISFGNVEAFKATFDSYTSIDPAGIGIFWNSETSELCVGNFGNTDLIVKIFNVDGNGRLNHIWSSSYPQTSIMQKIRLFTGPKAPAIDEYFIFIVTRKVGEHITGINYIAPKTKEDWEVFGNNFCHDFALDTCSEKVPVVIGRLARGELVQRAELQNRASQQVEPQAFTAAPQSMPAAAASLESSQGSADRPQVWSSLFDKISATLPPSPGVEQPLSVKAPPSGLPNDEATTDKRQWIIIDEGEESSDDSDPVPSSSESSPQETIDLVSPEYHSPGPSTVPGAEDLIAPPAEGYDKQVPEPAPVIVSESDEETTNIASEPSDGSWTSEEDEPTTLSRSSEIRQDMTFAIQRYGSAETRHWFIERPKPEQAFLPHRAKGPTGQVYHFGTLLYRGRHVKANKKRGTLRRFGKARGTLISSEMIIISESLKKKNQKETERVTKMLKKPPPFPQYPDRDLLGRLELKQDTFALMVNRANGDLMVQTTGGCPMVFLGLWQTDSQGVQMRPHLFGPGSSKLIAGCAHDEIYAIAPYQALKAVSQYLPEIKDLREEGSIERIAAVLEKSAKVYRVPRKYEKTGSRARSPVIIVFKIAQRDGRLTEGGSSQGPAETH